MRSKIGMMSWDHRMVVADGMINGLGYQEIREKLAAAGLGEEDLPSDDSMRTYRDGREMKTMMMDRIKAQHEHQCAARVADRVGSLIDLSTVRALEGIHRDLGEPDTSLDERLKALRVLVMYRRQLFLERQAGDVKPHQANHVVLESDLENPGHILFEEGSRAAYTEEEMAADRSRQERMRAAAEDGGTDEAKGGGFNTEGTETAERDTGAAEGADVMSGDGSGYMGVNGDKSGYVGVNGDESPMRRGDDRGLADRDEGMGDVWMEDGDEDWDEDEGPLISEAEVRSMRASDLDYLAATPEFSVLLAELEGRSDAEVKAWIQTRFPESQQSGVRLLWQRVIARHHARAGVTSDTNGAA